VIKNYHAVVANGLSIQILSVASNRILVC